MQKVCARWVPHDLSAENKKKRMGAALEFWSRYQEEGDECLNHIVTGDETWVHYWMPETKQASKQWKKSGERAPKKFKERPSAGKVLVTMFWDRKGIIHTAYMPQGTTITTASYLDTLWRLQAAIKRKRPGLLTEGVSLFHNNAPAHSAGLTQAALKNLKWKVFSHPPYSPDLAPSNYHLFPAIK